MRRQRSCSAGSAALPSPCSWSAATELQPHSGRFAMQPERPLCQLPAQLRWLLRHCWGGGALHTRIDSFLYTMYKQEAMSDAPAWAAMTRATSCIACKPVEEQPSGRHLEHLLEANLGQPPANFGRGHYSHYEHELSNKPSPSITQCLPLVCETPICFARPACCRILPPAA